MAFEAKQYTAYRTRQLQAQNILLTVYSLGLGTCWIGAFNENDVKKVLNAPEGIMPMATIPVSYPEENPLQRNRRPINQIMHREGSWSSRFFRGFSLWISNKKSIKEPYSISCGFTEAWKHMHEQANYLIQQKCLSCQLIIKGGDWKLLSRDCDGCSQMKACSKRYWVVDKGDRVYCPDGTAHLVDGQ